MNDGAGYAAQTLEGPQNQIRAGLGEHLNRDVIRYEALLDQLAHEVVVGLGGGRETDLDFLEADAHELLEHPALARGIHWLDQGLVAVAQIDTAPHGRGGDGARRPGTVGYGNRSERSVFFRGCTVHESLLSRRASPGRSFAHAAGHRRERSFANAAGHRRERSFANAAEHRRERSFANRRASAIPVRVRIQLGVTVLSAPTVGAWGYVRLAAQERKCERQQRQEAGAVD